METELKSAEHSSVRDDPTLQRATKVLIGVVVFVVLASMLALARNGEPGFLDFLYAEDGEVFYSEARATGLRSVLNPYAGYLHLVPRAASLVIVTLPVDAVAAAYSAVATVLVALLAVYVFFASRVLLESWQSRALLVGVMIVPPFAGQTIGNVGNFHWYLMFAAFWAVFSMPRNKWWAAAGATITGVVALSNPLVVLLMPVAAIAMNRYRSRLHGAVIAGMVVGLVVQAPFVIGSDKVAYDEASWLDLPGIFGFRVAGGLTIGDVYLADAWLRAGWVVPVVASAVLVLLAVLAVRMTAGWRQMIVIGAVATSLLFLSVSLIIRGTATLVPVIGEAPSLHSGRYTLLPGLLFVVCVAVLLDHALDKGTGRTRWAGVVATVWLVLVVAANVIITPVPNAPSWEEGLRSARHACDVEHAVEAEIVIAPYRPWSVTLPCADL